jgi:hypothetical protein
MIFAYAHIISILKFDIKPTNHIGGRKAAGLKTSFDLVVM